MPGERLCPGYFRPEILAPLQSFVIVSPTDEEDRLRGSPPPPRYSLECFAMRRGDNLKFKFSKSGFMTPIVTLGLRGGALRYESHFNDTQTQRGKLAGRFGEEATRESEPLTHSSTSSPAWDMFSSCIYHPLLAQALTVPHPKGQSELCVLATSIMANALRTPIPHFQTQRFSWNKANIKAEQSSPLSQAQANSCPWHLARLLQGLGLGLSPPSGEAPVGWYVGWERRCQGKRESFGTRRSSANCGLPIQ